MKDLTAVEWFFLNAKKLIDENQNPDQFEDFINYYHQAKKMERQKLINAYDWGQENEYQYHVNNNPKIDSEQYYNETFKK